MSESSVSRRAWLAGLGAAAGAGVLHPVVTAPGAGATAGPQLPAAGPSAIPQAFTASRSLKLNAFDFWPDQPQDGRFVSASGTFTSINNGNIEALVRLPDGAVPSRVQWRVLNSSGTTRSVSIYRISWPFLSLSSAGFTSVASSTSLQTFDTAITGGAADPNVYLLRMATLTTGTVAVYTAEFFYDDPAVMFRPVTPQARKLDTRQPGPLTGRIVNGSTKVLPLTPELPAGASLALVNLTVTNTEGFGFLTLYPAGQTAPGTSSINWYTTGQTVANSATVAVSAGGAVAIHGGGAGAAKADVIVDLLGYYR